MTMAPNCEACGKPIPKNPKWSFDHYAARRFCGRTCQAKRRPDILTDYAVSDEGCWEWQGPIDANGYGKAYDASMPSGRRIDWAHRVSYRAHVGPIPEGHELDHVCENTRCVNPEHLDPVTKAEHVRRGMERSGGLDRQRYAAHLRQLGLTYAEIADALGLLSRSAAQDKVHAAIRNGLVDARDVPPVVRLTEVERDEIRNLAMFNIPLQDIAAWYGIDGSQASRIVSGRTSRHLKSARRAS